MKRYILTGTPGSGKTSLIRALKRDGKTVIKEAATDVIGFRQRCGIPEPWKDASFLDQVVALQRRRQKKMEGVLSTIQFYDRSPLCTYALSLYLGESPSKLLVDEIDRMLTLKVYEKKVFFLDNLGFCKMTSARKITFEEALKFEAVHLEVYQKFGFECQHLPPVPIKERLEKLLYGL